MEESDTSRSVSDSVSTLIDCAETSGSGYAAGRSCGCEDEAYGVVSVASKPNHANDSHGPKVYSRSVDPRKLRVGEKYYVVYTFLHTSKSHSAAPGMHVYSAPRIARKNARGNLCLQLFTLHFLSWWSSQSNPNKLK